jgi:hypothetical protein
MSRRVAAGALAALAFAAGAAAARSEGSDPSLHSGAERGQTPRVVAREQGGGAVADLGLPASGAFALAYRHSYYRKPAVERFRAAADGSFALVAISSPSAAVLDYYEVEGERSRRDGWWTLRLARPARFESMALAATAVGRRTLVAGAERAPLYGSRGARHVTLAVEGS